MDAGEFSHILAEANPAAHQYGSALPDRPGFNTAGKQVTIKVNQYKVSRFPQTDVFQYDVSSIST